MVTKLNFEDGLQGDSSWTNKAPTGSQMFTATGSVFLEGNKQADTTGTRIDISRQDVDAVRTLRALAYLHTTGSFDADPHRTAELQRLTSRQASRWAVDIERQLALSRDDPAAVDPEVGYLADALILSAQMIGIDSGFAPDNPIEVINAVLSHPPGLDLGNLPVPFRKLREYAIGEKGKSNRETLQQLLLRRTAYTQGGGKDAGIDTDRILRSYNRYTKDPSLPPNLPTTVTEYVDRLHKLIDNLDSVKSSIEAVLPDTSSAEGANLDETVEAVDTALVALQNLGMTTARVDVAKIKELGETLAANDAQAVVQVRQNLDKWQALTTTERLRALAGEWPESCARLGPWITTVDAALDAIEAHINTKIDPELQAKASQLDSSLAATLEQTATALAGLLDSADPA